MAGANGSGSPATTIRTCRRICRADTVRDLALGGLVFRPSRRGVLGRDRGHLHPCAHRPAPRNSVRRRCFCTDGNRLIMPAFGAYTGSLNVLDAPMPGCSSATG
jgi:metallophosphoesterase superfamily enzyme